MGVSTCGEQVSLLVIVLKHRVLKYIKVVCLQAQQWQ